MTEQAPIIFIHYGPSAYLRHTLRAAKQSNPTKKIYFFGDDTNRHFCPKGVDFVYFSKFSQNKKNSEFHSVFQPIEGVDHRFKKNGGTKHWLSFVFERWFLIEAAVVELGIKRFWTFDSDTLLLADLCVRESRFEDYCATEQCRGRCLNGLVNKMSVLADFNSWVIKLFRDSDYLESQKLRLRLQSGLCFNEMDAWVNFRQQNGINTKALGEPLEGEVFDDSLVVRTNFATAERRLFGSNPIKKVMLDKRGGAFAFHGPNGDPVRMVTMNMSWMPEWLYARVLPHCRPVALLPFNSRYCVPLKLDEPIVSRCWSLLSRAQARFGGC